MPITKIYEPVQYDTLNVDKEYQFNYNYIEDSSIEVYELIKEGDTTYRYLVPVTEYYVKPKTNRPRYPVKDGAEIKFTRNHSVGTVGVRIERNTLIDQTADFPKHHTPYNGRMVGVAFDKATMIFQEIAKRKCDVVTTTPLTQEVDWTAYDDFKKSVLKASVDKLFAIALEIDTTGENCEDRIDEA
jgi:hypothetical protein